MVITYTYPPNEQEIIVFKPIESKDCKLVLAGLTFEEVKE